MSTQQLVRQTTIPGVEQFEKPAHQPTPMTLIQLAVEQGADIEKLAKLMDLQERWEKNEARKAFVSAMNDFKAQPPTISKNKHVSFGQTQYNHATLDHVTDAVTQGLSKYGISHRWEVEQHDGKIKVTCVLTHDLGHSERVALEAPADTSGSKNAIQAIGSAVTYLQRYTLLAATGLAAKGTDDDGNSSQSMHNLAEHIEYIENCRNAEELEQVFRNAYSVASKLKSTSAQQALIAAKNKRKAELR